MVRASLVDTQMFPIWLTTTYRFKQTGKRDEIFLATKFGLFSSPERPVNGAPEYVRKAAEKSLERLEIETIDLYYYHRPDPTVPIEKTVAVMAELVKSVVQI